MRGSSSLWPKVCGRRDGRQTGRRRALSGPGRREREANLHGRGQQALVALMAVRMHHPVPLQGRVTAQVSPGCASAPRPSNGSAQGLQN